MRCTVKDVKTVLTELRTGKTFAGTHHETFAMRREQAEAVNKTHAYFHLEYAYERRGCPTNSMQRMALRAAADAKRQPAVHHKEAEMHRP